MSGGVGASQAELDRRALEDFLVGNRDLERLEALLDRFNILEALGVVRQELRHSDFLRFLLDPRNPHGLGDTFVKRLLQKILVARGDVPVSVTPIELELWDLGRVEVRREWQHIDILLLDEDHQLAVIVENKIGTREHSDQLQRYYRIVEEHHPGWRLIAVYLTPDGAPPSHESYLPVDYGLVCEVIDGLAEDRGSVVNSDVKTLMAHYTDTLRRHVLVDSDVARLSRLVYQKHKRAIDLIIEHRPDPRVDIQNLLTRLVNDTDGLVLKGTPGKRYVAFRPSEWEPPAALNAGKDELGFIRFLFVSDPDRLTLYLQVTPGDQGVRRKLYETGHKDELLFNDLIDPETNDYPNLYHRIFLGPGFYKDASESDREEEIRRHWSGFVEDDLPRIRAALSKEEWIWE